MAGPGGPFTVAGNLIGLPPDTALFFFIPIAYVEVPPSSDLDLANADLTIPLPAPWFASRDALHVYPVVDKLNLATNSGYVLYVEVQSTRPTCPTPPLQPPPGGAPSTTMMSFVFELGDGTSLSFYTSAPFFIGMGTFFPSPTPPSVLTPPPPSWTHVAATIDRMQNLGKFYLNGVHMPAATSRRWRVPTTPILCGSAARGCTARSTRRDSWSSRSTRSRSLTGRCRSRRSGDRQRRRRQVQADAGAERHRDTDAHGDADADADADRHGDTHTDAHRIGDAHRDAAVPAGVFCTPTPTSTPSPTPTSPCFAELCVFKFNDLDGDGFHDAGEPGLAGWMINIAITGGPLISTVTTGAAGAICTGVPAPASYTISEVLQDGWTQTFPPPPGMHFIGINCGHLVNLEFANVLPDADPDPHPEDSAAGFVSFCVDTP